MPKNVPLSGIFVTKLFIKVGYRRASPQGGARRELKKRIEQGLQFENRIYIPLEAGYRKISVGSNGKNLAGNPVKKLVASTG